MSAVNCQRFETLIGELVDGTLDGGPRHDLEAHLAACPACALLVEELLVVRRAARILPPPPLPPAAWERLSSALSREQRTSPIVSSWRPLVMPLAAAAMLVAAVAVAVLWQRDPAAQQTAGASRPIDPATATSDELLGSVEAELRQAERHYENAIAGLEVLAKDRRALDPQVATDLQKNLLVIDRAIGESRAALTRQPASEQAQDSLFEAFRSKIALLQDTIALINEMRKGNQAEAGRIAEGLNKS